MRLRLLRQYAAALGATFKRDLAIMLSYRTRLLSQVMSMLFTLATFFYLSKIVRPDAVGPHGRYYGFLVVGLVSMAILTSAFSISQLVHTELMSGNFERLVVSPLGPVTGVASLALFPMIYATMFACLMLALASGVFSIPIHMAGIPLAAAVALLGAIAFGAIGMFVVAGLVLYKSSLGASWVLAVMGLLSGVYFPVRLLPQLARWGSEVQPLSPAIDLLRHLLIGTRSIEPTWLELVKLGGFAAILVPASAGALWLAFDASRRRGTLLEF